jgi:hypothetical protein
MTDTDTIRRATDAEIATARAWVEHMSADWAQASDTEREKQQAYEYALEVLIFANGGRCVESPPFEPGSEIAVTVTGRVIHHNSDATLVEYVKANGFTDRVIVHNGADVEFRAAPAPDQATLAARERAARLVAVACMDPDSQRRVHTEWVARFNDAYPPGSPVRYWTGHRDGDGRRAATSGPAWLFAEHTAAVRVEGSSDPIALSHVEPITEES